MKTNRSALFLLSSLQSVLLRIIVVFTAAQSLGATHYVNLNSPSPAPPYATWETAATNIQDAVSIALAGETILATNGAYADGGIPVYGQVTNRVALTNALVLLSVNGPEVTTIIGGFQHVVLTSEATPCFPDSRWPAAPRGRMGTYRREQSGGGAWFEQGGTVSNCIIASNTASYLGGGAYAGTLYKCVLTNNRAQFGGGAAAGEYNERPYGGTLSNCVFSGNFGEGGGAYYCNLFNCTLSNNISYGPGGGTWGGTLSNCTLTANHGGGVCLIALQLHRQ